jgi:2-haloacid dehalogenase
MKKYETIIFDADETLFDFKKSEKEAFKHSMLEFNFPYDEAIHLKTYQAINTKIWKEFEEGLITQEELKIQRFIRLKEELKLEFDVNQFAKAYMRHLAQASFLFEESYALVKRLSLRYHLVMITNGLKDVQDLRIKRSTIAHFFQNITVSEEVGVSKPNPKIFEYALNEPIDRSKILMVGDSLTSDIQGGINYGIDTCWINLLKKENTSSIKPTYEIHQLTDLINILQS